MMNVGATLSRLAIIALIVQLLTPWQVLHLSMMDASTDSGLSQSHCPTQSMSDHDHHPEPDSRADAFSDACERACGMTLTELSLIALVPVMVVSQPLGGEHIFPTPFFSTVPNPPPIV